MKVLYIINGLGFSENTGIGGSDKRAIEVIRHVHDKRQNSDRLDILTTSSGYRIFKKDEKLNTKYHVILPPIFWPVLLNKYLFGRILSYFYAMFTSIPMIKKFRNYSLFFATSDFFFDVIPGYFFARVYGKEFVCMIHHHIVDPSSRDGNKFVNILMNLSQRFSFWFIKNTADKIFLYDTDEGRKIQKLLFYNQKSKSVYFVKNGIDINLIDAAKQGPKIYEACFLGGIRYSKGIREFIPIWKKVVNVFPNAKFIVIGGGSGEIVNWLSNEIKTYNMENNIILTGPLSGIQLFEKMKSSKIFLFPSHEEGWGIALCEAMYCELPVVCYDLPAFKAFGGDLNKSKIGDWNMLANKTILYLRDEKKALITGKKLKKIAEKFTWEKIAEEDMSILSDI